MITGFTQFEGTIFSRPLVLVVSLLAGRMRRPTTILFLFVLLHLLLVENVDGVGGRAFLHTVLIFFASVYWQLTMRD